jgi:hypothetical protein
VMRDRQLVHKSSVLIAHVVLRFARSYIIPQFFPGLSGERPVMAHLGPSNDR